MKMMDQSPRNSFRRTLGAFALLFVGLCIASALAMSATSKHPGDTLVLVYNEWWFAILLSIACSIYAVVIYRRFGLALRLVLQLFMAGYVLVVELLVLMALAH